MADHHRINGLDGLRLLAALCVVAVHYTFDFAGSRHLVSASVANFGWIGRYGYLGVSFFFILSGFVIGISASGATFAGFLSRRVARISPLFVVCGAITMAVLLWSSHWSGWIGIYLVGLTFFPQQVWGHDFIGATYWTLTYEVTFYGWVSFLIATGKYEKWNELFCLSWLVICAAGDAGWLPGGLRTVFATGYAPLFVMGLAIYLMRTKGSRTAIILFACAGALASWNEVQHMQALNSNLGAVEYQLWVAPMAVLGAAGLVFAGSMWHSDRFALVLSICGAVSYPLYLLHFELSQVAIQQNAWFGTPPGVAVMLLLLFLLSGALAAADAKWRKPIQGLVETALSGSFRWRLASKADREP